MENKAWFQDARFGMFIHWGAYAVAGRSEWVLNREFIPYSEYTERYVNHFTAERYDPEGWVRLAKEAGMKYVVLTTRHHDGFALWDTETTPFNAARLGPHRDLVRPFVEAVRDAGLKVGLYYSFADWSHPDYPGAYARDWPEEWKSEESRLRFIQYYQAQLKELMTRYGKIDILWYDGCAPGPTDGATINSYIRSVQPDILISNRNGKPYDFVVSESAIRTQPGQCVESCMTLNDNWGYCAGDHNYKTPYQVIKMLGAVAAGGGNLLLNIGPRADGTVPEESVAILRKVGEWMKINGEAIYGTDSSPFSWVNGYGITTKGSSIYLLLYQYADDEVCVADIANEITGATLLATGEALPFRQQEGRLFVTLPQKKVSGLYLPVVKLTAKGEPKAITPKTKWWVMEM